jgi:hypothetical protein
VAKTAAKRQQQQEQGEKSFQRNDFDQTPMGTSKSRWKYTVLLNVQSISYV